MITTILSESHSQALKQYSINYDTLLSIQETLTGWLKVQNKIV